MPLVPVTVSVNVPRTAFDVVFTVILDDPGAATWLGWKVAVAPDASPVTESETLPANPERDETVTVYKAERPRRIETDDGLTVIEKSGGAETTSVIDAVWVTEPLVPTTVNG